MGEPQELFDRYLSTHLGYVQQGRNWTLIREIYRHLYLPHLPDEKTTPILEVGCGKGDFLRFLIEEGYTNILGVDIGREQVEYCRTHVTESVLLIDDLREFLNQHKSQFGCIVMIDVLEHIPRSDLLEIGRALWEGLRGKGDRLIVKTLNAANPMASLIFFSDLTHEFMFSEVSLRQWCLASGFSNVDFFPGSLPRKGLRRWLRLSLQKLLFLWYRIQYYANYVHLDHNILSVDLIAVATK